jgi:hypothetical protein
MGLISRLTYSDGRSLTMTGFVALVAASLLSNVRYLFYLLESAVFYLTGHVARRRRNSFLKGIASPDLVRVGGVGDIIIQTACENHMCVQAQNYK